MAPSESTLFLTIHQPAPGVGVPRETADMPSMGAPTPYLPENCSCIVLLQPAGPSLYVATAIARLPSSHHSSHNPLSAVLAKSTQLLPWFTAKKTLSSAKAKMSATSTESALVTPSLVRASRLPRPSPISPSQFQSRNPYLVRIICTPSSQQLILMSALDW
jgi:hypothetical protein